MRIAIKELTQSDLSFFKAHLRLSKQKAINLNAEVFIDRFYPTLRNVIDAIPFQISIVGPGGKPAHKLMRKALRSGGAKNWRLNGEFVSDPDDDAGRYDGLKEGDYAILAFEGTIKPEAATLILVSQAKDQELHNAIEGSVQISARHTMVETDDKVIEALRVATLQFYATDHPLDALSTCDTIEDVLFDDATLFVGAPVARARSIPISPAELRRQLAAAEEVGERGEAIFEEWLIQNAVSEDDFTWTSRTHARAAFDFEVAKPSWKEVKVPIYIDVKSTRGGFDRAIHMSVAELKFAASRPEYRIARVYDIDADVPGVILLSGVDVLAEAILISLKDLPSGVKIDSVQLDVGLLTVVQIGIV